MSRELGITAATIAGRRDQCLGGGQAALKSRPADERDEEIARCAEDAQSWIESA